MNIFDFLKIILKSNTNAVFFLFSMKIEAFVSLPYKKGVTNK